MGARRARRTRRASGATGDTKPPVLVVDDHALFRHTLRELLEEEGGYVVEEAADGHAALARIRVADGPLVVLLDFFLPGLTGEQVLDTVVAEAGEAGSRRIRGCILMSTLPELAEPAALRHHLPLLAKPFTAEEVLQTVARVATEAAQAWS
jgi:CheY-like chemotaxis protein